MVIVGVGDASSEGNASGKSESRAAPTQFRGSHQSTHMAAKNTPDGSSVSDMTAGYYTVVLVTAQRTTYKGHFTHETEGPRPLHFKHSHWWKSRSRSNFASRCAGGTNGVKWM